MSDCIWARKFRDSNGFLINSAGAISEAYSDILSSLIISGDISANGFRDPSRPVVTSVGQAESGYWLS